MVEKLQRQRENSKHHHRAGTLNRMFTADELSRLRHAFNVRDAADRIINAARSKVRGKNKTHALRKLLGLCPECGNECPDGRHYCDPCRITMNARHRKSK